MTSAPFDAKPHHFWQEIVPADTYDLHPEDGYETFFPVRLPDGMQLALPIRAMTDGQTALASLIINQASFKVIECLAIHLAELLRPFAPAVVAGLPTLGLTLAAEVARHLGHTRFVPLSTSRKFWFEEELSAPMRSITSPDQEKRLYMDPRMLPVLRGQRVVLIDDVLSTGTSILSGLRVLRRCDVDPVAIGAAMLQTRRWQTALEQEQTGLSGRVVGVFQTPYLIRMARQEQTGRVAWQQQ